jgi:hypothetical protein
MEDERARIDGVEEGASRDPPDRPIGQEISKNRRAPCSRFRLRHHWTGLLTSDRDHVPGVQLCSPSRLNLPVHQHLIGLDKLPRMRPVLSKTSQLEELTQPNRQVGDRNVLNR